MRWLKILLAVNGVAYAYYGVSNLVLPTSFFLPADAADHALTAVRLVAVASLLVAGLFAAVAALQGSGSTTVFQQVGLVSAVGNAVVAVLYLFLLYRERAETA